LTFPGFWKKVKGWFDFMARRLVVAVSKAVTANEEGKKLLLGHFAKSSPDVQEAYSEMLEDMITYRTILTEHRIGEFQASQKEKVKRTAGLVGLQVPILYEDDGVSAAGRERKQ
jgi:hypothetical protein